MSYILVSAISLVVGACIGVTIMACVIAGSKVDDILLGDRQYHED